jgi:hypothetical protein
LVRCGTRAAGRIRPCRRARPRARRTDDGRPGGRRATSAKCICKSLTQRRSSTYPLSAISTFRTTARTPASTAGCSTGRTPASRRRPRRRRRVRACAVAQGRRPRGAACLPGSN